MLTRIVFTLAIMGAAALAPVEAQQLVISTYAGGPPATIPVLGVNSAIGVPAGATTDPAGNMYFISLYSGVFKLDRSGILTRIAGTMWGGYALGYSGDGGPAINAQFCFPGYEDVYAGISGIAVDSTGNVYVADGGNYRIRKISSAGIVTTIAGNGEEGYLGDGGPAIKAQLGFLTGLAIDSSGNLYAADDDSNAIRLLQPVSSSTVISGVVNAASSLAGAIAPGELIAITGFGLGPAQLVSAAPGSDGLYPTQLAGTTVEVNGIPATLIYTWGTQVAAVVPDSVGGDAARVAVTYQGRRSASFSVPVTPTAPGIFTANVTGKGYAATINQNGSINTAAHGGDILTLFLTGAGHATPAVASRPGQALPLTQGTVPGVMQIKVPIPVGADCDLPVVFQVGNASSQAGVTIAVDICI